MSWNQPITRGTKRDRPRPLAAIDGRVTFEAAVETWIAQHVMPGGRHYATTTQNVIRSNLLGSRLTGWRKGEDIETVDQWNADKAVKFMRWYQDEMHADADTVRKFRTQLRQFGRFCADKYGHADSIGPALDALRIAAGPTDPKDKVPALSKGESDLLLGTAPTTRDQLIVALLLYTGLRPSELVALEERHVDLARNPPVVVIEGSVHNPTRTKTEAGARTIPLNVGGHRKLTSLMRTHLTDPKRPRGAEYLLLSKRLDSQGNPERLTIGGLDLILARLEKATGIKCNAYRFRHTFCTRCADGGMAMTTLQQLLGHKTIEMVAYYYRGKTSQEVLEAATRIRF